MRLADGRSIVAIDPTTRGIAFVFFENGEVMDWGERISKREAEDELRIIDRLVDGCAADVLVLEDPDAEGCLRRPRIRSLLRAIARHGRRRGVAVLAVSRGDVRSSWAMRGVTNKEDIAAKLADRFSELQGVVPPRRKAWASEAPRVNVFDAASLVLHYDETSRGDSLP